MGMQISRYPVTPDFAANRAALANGVVDVECLYTGYADGTNLLDLEVKEKMKEYLNKWEYVGHIEIYANNAVNAVVVYSYPYTHTPDPKQVAYLIVREVKDEN